MQDVVALGRAGDSVEVRLGYAINHLLPKKVASLTPGPTRGARGARGRARTAAAAVSEGGEAAGRARAVLVVRVHACVRAEMHGGSVCVCDWCGTGCGEWEAAVAISAAVYR